MAATSHNHAGGVPDNESANDTLTSFIRRSLSNSVISGLVVENGKVIFSDVGTLAPTSAASLAWWMRDNSGHQSAVYLATRGIPYTGFTSQGSTNVLRSPKLTRNVYINPMPSAYATVDTSFAADYVSSPSTSAYGTTVTWRWPLDSRLSQGLASGPAPFYTGPASCYFDQDQVTSATPGAAASTAVTPPLPVAAIQISFSPSGWSVASTTTNAVPYQPSTFSAGAGAPAVVSSAVSSSYETVPTGAFHIAIGWVDYGGSYQHATIQVEPFSDNVSNRTTLTMLFASKAVTWTQSTRSTYDKYGDRDFVPAGLRYDGIVSGATLVHLDGPDLGLNTCSYTGSSSSSAAQPGCSWVSVRIYYEAPVAGTATRLLNPVSCRVSLRTVDELARIGENLGLLSTPSMLAAPGRGASAGGKAPPTQARGAEPTGVGSVGGSGGMGLLSDPELPTTTQSAKTKVGRVVFGGGKGGLDGFDTID